MNFQLKQRFNWSLFELEGMLPFERIVYVALLEEKLKEEAQTK